ncbi:MAG: hypothetical protein HY520_02375 [Candidatus Aenigmarchaeota archaeon]|nr:hypothetical protein [Candidatus Aenigmarchaeota archaeon]
MDITLFPVRYDDQGLVAGKSYVVEVPDGITADRLLAQVGGSKIERWEFAGADGAAYRTQAFRRGPLLQGEWYLLHSRDPDRTEQAISTLPKPPERALRDPSRTGEPYPLASGRDVLWFRILEGGGRVAYQAFHDLDRPPIWEDDVPEGPALRNQMELLYKALWGGAQVVPTDARFELRGDPAIYLQVQRRKRR